MFKFEGIYFYQMQNSHNKDHNLFYKNNLSKQTPFFNRKFEHINLKVNKTANIFTNQQQCSALARADHECVSNGSADDGGHGAGGGEGCCGGGDCGGDPVVDKFSFSEIFSVN